MINFRLALRALFKTPVVTLCAIVSIALGIGANTAIFTVFEQALLRRLPVRDPGRLVNLSAPGPQLGSSTLSWAGGVEEVFSYPVFRDLEKTQQVFAGMAAHCPFAANISARGTTTSGQGLFVSGSYFPLLGIQPALGRLLNPQDDHVIGESRVAVLSHRYWETRFGRDVGALNQTTIINGQLLTIVGVAPRGFDGTTFGLKPQVFVPITMGGSMRPLFAGFENRWNHWIYLFGRLNPGMTSERAGAALNGRFHAIINDIEAPQLKDVSEQTMAWFKSKKLVLERGDRGQSTILKQDTTKAGLRLLFGISAFVVIIACVNVVNLMLARGIAREGEMAIRLSIGASRLRIGAQLFTESHMLAIFAGSAGILAAQWTLDSIALLIPEEMANLVQLTLDTRAIGFAALLTIGTGLLLGFFPVLHSIRPDLFSSLKGQAWQQSGAKTAARFRTALVTMQIALSVALLITAGLFTKSLYNISHIDLGMKVDHVIAFSISPVRNGYSAERAFQLFERLKDELAAVPGITGVTASEIPLLSGMGSSTIVMVEGYDPGSDMDRVSGISGIGTEYFRTLGIPLISGREFTRSDTSLAPKVAIVNEAFAKKFRLGREVIGKHVNTEIEIVGLARNSKQSHVIVDTGPMIFLPYRQHDFLDQLAFYVQSTLNPDQLFPSIKKAVAKLDPNLPVEDLRMMQQQVARNAWGERTIGILSTAFACLSILLAAVGLYGVLAYAVAQRTREIGLRIALGASQRQVRSMVLRQVGLMTLIGVVIGLTCAIGLGRASQSLLYRMQGYDPAVFCGSAVLLILVALVAGFIPAYRASKIEPMEALRYE
jgi:predicted permease